LILLSELQTNDDAPEWLAAMSGHVPDKVEMVSSRGWREEAIFSGLID
jgi:hypothetical protein